MRILGRRCKITLTSSLAFSWIIVLVFASSVNLQAQPEVFSPGSKPHGKSYGEWSEEWWKWLQGIPKDRNPAADTTGAFCDVNQNATGPVWFLAGTFGSKEERSCIIPFGKSILISPIEIICSFADTPGTKTEEDLKKCAKEDQDKVNFVRVTVDGVDIPNMREYRIQSSMFNLSLPENNVVGVPAQETTGVSDGYFVMLKPLSRGEHEIRSTGSLVDVTVQGTQNFAADVIYHVTIE
jgi:hypothetical protein